MDTCAHKQSEFRRTKLITLNDNTYSQAGILYRAHDLHSVQKPYFNNEK